MSALSQDSHGCCPNCGYCSKCGRSNTYPYFLPYTPYPYYTNPYIWINTTPTGIVNS